MTNSRQKGKRGEREAAEALRALGFVGARRGQQYCGTAGDADIVDAIPDTHIEVKRTETLSVYKAMDQAVTDAAPGKIPVVLHKRNRRDWLIIVSLDDLQALANRVAPAK